MMSFKVRDEFSEMREFALNLPDTFDRIGSVLHNSRNVIKKVSTSQGTFVVKSFKGMYLFNKIAYSLFRKSKAVRSYLYSAVLNEKGISTPAHVAWVDCYKMGLLTGSYFVSVYDTNQTLEQVLFYYNNNENVSGKREFLVQLAAFAKKLHDLGIYHEDFSVGNILVKKSPEGYDFSLLDLNRVRFRKVNFHKGLRNFFTMNLSRKDMDVLIAEYARLSGQLPAEAINEFWLHHNRKSNLRRLRRKIRRNTIARFESIVKR